MLNSKTDAIVLKLYKDGMIVYINEDMPFAELRTAVCEKFRKSGSFFQGIAPHVGFKGITLSDVQYEELICDIAKVLGCIVTLWEQPEAMKQTTEEKVRQAQNTDEVLENALAIDIDYEYTKFYRKTVRSGQLLESDGHIVIIGDVNPGAEIIAAGNIFVMGNVKGTVHAGAKGNREAVVAGLNLSPTQLRIANIITRSPDGEVNKGLTPEIAYIKDDKIFIEDFLQKRK